MKSSTIREIRKLQDDLRVEYEEKMDELDEQILVIRKKRGTRLKEYAGDLLEEPGRSKDRRNGNW